MSKSGIVNMIKPPGMSSRDLVGWVKKHFDSEKAGHTGTLDPLAAGVLPVCLQKATKIISYLPETKKEYIGEITLGKSTTTLDKEGEIKSQDKNWQKLTRKNLKEVFKKYTGEIHQIPPMFSAVKKDGKKLYELARKGEKVTRKPRKINIYKLRLMEVNFPHFQFQVQCSRGTYIRALARDIGEDLNTASHLSFLVRTASGIFKIKDAFSLSRIMEEKLTEREKFIIPLDQPLDCPQLFIKDSEYHRAVNGNYLIKENFEGKEETIEDKLKTFDLFRIYDTSNHFLALYRINKKKQRLILKSEKVFAE